MTRNETMKQFKKNEVERVRNQVLLELEYDFQNQKERLAEEFGSCFLCACSNIVTLQEEGRLSDVEFILLTVLRTGLMYKDFMFPFKVLNNLWWLDESQRDVGFYNGEFVFQYFNKMEKILLEERKQYLFKLLPQDIEIIMQAEAPNFILYIGRIAKYHILKLTESNEFRSIRTGSKIQFQVTEYMDNMEIIYQEKLTHADMPVIMQQIESKKSEVLCFEDLRALNLSEMDLTESDFRFSDFRGSDFHGSDLRYSSLIGTNFQNCNMEEVDFRFCYLNEAVFIRSNLRNACLRKVEAYQGLQIEDYWDTVGYYPINFTEADLVGADFQGSNLKGAVFRGAKLEGAVFDGVKLEGADFRGVKLKGAVFNGAKLEGADFRGVNLEGIVFSGANLKGADFSGANLKDAEFDGSELKNATFTTNQLNDVKLKHEQINVIKEVSN